MTRLVAVCCGRPRPDETRLREFACRQLEAWQVPEFVVLDAMPTLANGKINWLKIARVAKEACHRAADGGSTDLTITERRVAAIWQRTLGVDSVVGKDANFFALGGSSLLAVDCLRLVEREFGKRITMMQLTERPQLSEFARLVGQDKPVSESPRLISPLRAGQHAVLLVGSLEPADALLRHLPDEFAVHWLKIPGLHTRLRGRLSLERMIEVCYAAVTGHEKTSPVAIVAYSFGGLLAHGLAQRLAETGSRPPLTFLIEPLTPLKNAATSSSTRPSQTRNARHAKLRQQVLRLVKGKSLARRLRLVRAWSRDVLGMPLESRERWELFRPVVHRTRRRFRAGCYAGPVVLVGTRGFIREHRLTWQTLVADGPEVLVLDCDSGHHRPFEPPHDANWATHLATHLARWTTAEPAPTAASAAHE